MRTFPGSNTPEGFYSYYDDLINEQQRLFLLKGGPGTGKSTLMRRVGKYWQDKGFQVDWHHCSGDPTSLDAVSIPEIKALVVDATLPHALEPKSPGIVEEIISLGNFWDREQLIRNKSDIMEYVARGKNEYRIAYGLLREGAAARSGVAEYYASYCKTQWKKMGIWKAELMELLGQGTSQGSIYHCFFSAMTAMGCINLSPSLLQTQTRLLPVRGAPGSGLTEFFCSVAREAWERGHRVILLADPMSPKEWEGIYLPDRQIAVVTIGEESVTGGLYDSGLMEVARNIPIWADLDGLLPEPDEMVLLWGERCRLRMQDAQVHLQNARDIHRKVEQYYIPAMDFDAVEERSRYIIKEMEGLQK